MAINQAHLLFFRLLLCLRRLPSFIFRENNCHASILVFAPTHGDHCHHHHWRHREQKAIKKPGQLRHEGVIDQYPTSMMKNSSSLLLATFNPSIIVLVPQGFHFHVVQTGHAIIILDVIAGAQQQQVPRLLVRLPPQVPR
jgi:hypothetical protein